MWMDALHGEKGESKLSGSSMHGCSRQLVLEEEARSVDLELDKLLIRPRLKVRNPPFVMSPGKEPSTFFNADFGLLQSKLNRWNCCHGQATTHSWPDSAGQAWRTGLQRK